jgi:hypothetical protein
MVRRWRLTGHSPIVYNPFLNSRKTLLSRFAPFASPQAGPCSCWAGGVPRAPRKQFKTIHFCIAAGRAVFVLGGRGPSRTKKTIQNNSKQFKTIHFCIVAGRAVFVLGGRGPSRTKRNDVWRLDTHTWRWTQLHPTNAEGVYHKPRVV